ncbi:hypothetical protein AN189_03270 [Loktanella sp. 3ANDIMAR09]|nr:hypothetical protein AN189_03270 [Loktanella sp. 3ANDIMAR09]
MDPDRFAQVMIDDDAALWDWLHQHHAQSDSVWLVTWKRGAGPTVSRDAVLDALLAHGWIDGRRMARDDGRTMQLISPRSQQRWTQTYRDRVTRLTAQGQMHSAGLACVAAAQRAGTWYADLDVDALIVPDDLQAALDTAGGASWFSNAAPSYRRNILRYLKSAKQAATRDKRITLIATTAARGQKVPNY